MLFRQAHGRMPRKHHLVCRDDEGALLHEECLTRAGFDGPYSILYHRHRPHSQRAIDTAQAYQAPVSATPQRLLKRHYRTPEIPRRGVSLLGSRVPLLFNQDVVLGMAYPDVACTTYFANGDGDDLYFVLAGEGTVRSVFGDLPYAADDYLCIPRGVIHRFVPNAHKPHTLLSIECTGGVGLCQQWRNQTGQLRMDAPYCHRDFRLPNFVGPQDEGIRELLVKRGQALHGFLYDHSPLDVVGWDGSVYPWAFSILNFQPRAGLVHLPPTWHGTFAAPGALICSFVPRMLDFHPEAIPCPYPHASVDCDEFLFYVRGNFTSRRGVGAGSISHHPAGIAHGPHPGAYEGSIGHRETHELAVMLDTARPLLPTEAAVRIEDPTYQQSFCS